MIFHPKDNIEKLIPELCIMDIGVYLRRSETYEEMLNLAQRADELGYFGLFLNDHVIGFANDAMEPYLEAWTAMTGIGVQTKNIRIGQIVLFNSLRNPAFLAKSVATLDRMTNGRYELLIGAGWREDEYTGYDLMEKGTGMPSAKERVDRFEETLKILKLMLNQDSTDFDGNYWKLKNAINTPPGIQKPMRLSVGCKAPRMMRITAELADGINISGRTLKDVAELINKFETIVGRFTEKSIKDYYISGFSGVMVSENDEKINSFLKPRVNSQNMTLDEARKQYLVGNKEEMITKLRYLNDIGIDMMVKAIEVDTSLTDDPLSYYKDEILSAI